MVKWSGVTDAEGAGKKISRFLFPILQTKKVILIVGQEGFGEKFYQSFKAEAFKISPEAEVHFSSSEGHSEAFVLEIRNLDEKFIKKNCPTPCIDSFVHKKALNKFNNKNRKSSRIWINGYRLNEQKALFFYKINQQ